MAWSRVELLEALQLLTACRHIALRICRNDDGALKINS